MNVPKRTTAICKWVFGKRKCKNHRHRFEAEFCESHAQLEGQIEGFRRARSFLVGAGRLTDDAETKTRDPIYSEYVVGCEGWSAQLFKLVHEIDRQIKQMDADWALALPRLERRAMKRDDRDG